MGERGRVNEEALAALLASFVPERVGVGTGFLIDSQDRRSPQTDVILYETGDQPALMAQTVQVLYPVEVALAAVEVKTTLDGTALRDCVAKRRKTYELKPATGRGLPMGHPPFVVLAYNAGLGPDTYMEYLLEDPEHRPDLLCVLDIGLIAGAPRVLSGAHSDWTAGLAFAQKPNSDSDWIEADRTAEHVEHEGRLVSVVKYGAGYYAADPGRALLLFADALSRLVALRGGLTEPVLTHYLDDRARTLAPVWPAEPPQGQG